jgi:hypothetical protein
MAKLFWRRCRTAPWRCCEIAARQLIVTSAPSPLEGSRLRLPAYCKQRPSRIHRLFAGRISEATAFCDGRLWSSRSARRSDPTGTDKEAIQRGFPGRPSPKACVLQVDSKSAFFYCLSSSFIAEPFLLRAMRASNSTPQRPRTAGRSGQQQGPFCMLSDFPAQLRRRRSKKSNVK